MEKVARTIKRQREKEGILVTGKQLDYLAQRREVWGRAGAGGGGVPRMTCVESRERVWSPPPTLVLLIPPYFQGFVRRNSFQPEGMVCLENCCLRQRPCPAHVRYG